MLDSLFAIWAVCWMIVMIPSYPWTNSPQGGGTPYGYSLFKTVALLVGIILIIIIVLSEHHLLIR